MGHSLASCYLKTSATVNHTDETGKGEIEEKIVNLGAIKLKQWNERNSRNGWLKLSSKVIIFCDRFSIVNAFKHKMSIFHFSVVNLETIFF